MKYIIAFLLFLPNLSFGFGVAGHAVAHASAHASVHTVGHTSVAAHESMPIAAHESMPVEHPLIFHPVFNPRASHQEYSEDNWYEYNEPFTMCPVGNNSIVCGIK